MMTGHGCVGVSIILQQPLDVVELDLRPRRIGEAAAELFEDTPDPLHVDLAGNLHRQIVAIFAAAQRTSERIGLVAAALLPADTIPRAVAGLIAVALLHRFRKALRALA